MQIMHSKPLTAQAKAKPIPVLPDVAYTILLPYFKTPFLIESSTILLPILSFTEPPIFINSHLASN